MMRFRNFLFLLLTFVSFAQQTHKVDFKTADAFISVNPVQKEVSGTVKYTFQVLSAVDTIRIDAKKMTFSDVRINNKTVKFKVGTTALKLFEGFKIGKNTVEFVYTASPSQTMYFTGSGENLQVWTQGQGKYTSHWLPSFDDMNEKVIFNFGASFETGFEVISNGTLKSKKSSGNSTEWHYGMKHPMSSYLVMIAIGKFAPKAEKSASGKDLVMYVDREDLGKLETTYNHSKSIFDFFEKEIGVEYPWEIYKQVPVRDFLYAGMENTSATVFAQDFVVDEIAVNDRDYINVNAHELAHQWFGDMVTAKSGKDHWLQEGFATYYALLSEQSLFGDDHFNYKLYEMAEELQRASAKDTLPVLNEKASSLTFYKKGAWALHILREGVGHEKFRAAVKAYLNKYAFKNVDTNMFLTEINKVSDFDTASFKKKWLEKSGFDVAEAIVILKKNESMGLYFSLLEMNPKPFAEKADLFASTLKSNVFTPIKEEIVFQTANVPFDEKKPILDHALQTNDIKVRQAVASTTGKMPASFYDSYVTLLDDQSYITKGIALKNLWEQFPEKQKEILNKTNGYIGFNDKNFRIQWLTLALGTRDFEKENKLGFYDELMDYTSVNYESSIRMNALENLLFFNPNDVNVLKNLVNPLTHHKWQFSLFAREKIREKIKKDVYRDYFIKLLPSLPEIERRQLQRLLDEK
jgi:aminopeptidase N